MYTSSRILLLALGMGLGLVSTGAQDINLDSDHNSTSLQGTWSSGTKGVVTGSVSCHSCVIRWIVLIYLLTELCESREPVVYLPQDDRDLVYFVCAISTSTPE